MKNLLNEKEIHKQSEEPKQVYGPTSDRINLMHHGGYSDLLVLPNNDIFPNIIDIRYQMLRTSISELLKNSILTVAVANVNSKLVKTFQIDFEKNGIHNFKTKRPR